jgi:hypothetical protein
MDTITITHHGQTVALAARARFWLAAHIEALPTGHPDKRHVCFMALYARDILTGELPGPYNDADADRFARLALQPDNCPSPCADRPPRSRADCAPHAPPLRRIAVLVRREPPPVLARRRRSRITNTHS